MLGKQSFPAPLNEVIKMKDLKSKDEEYMETINTEDKMEEFKDK